MKRSPLKRTGSLKRSGFKQKSDRKPMRQRSKKRAKEEDEYNEIVKARKEELNQDEAYCPVAFKLRGEKLRIDDVHHAAGKEGDLLLDERHWLFVSRWGHTWIHDNGREARKHGWLYEV